MSPDEKRSNEYTPRIIVYHDQCNDGIAALWVCLQKYPDAEEYPGMHGVPPDVERFRGADVTIVDFSWPRDELLAVAAVAHSVVVLDHHETSEAELSGLPWAIFDMNRSGAGLAWDTLFRGQPRPPLIDYVEDRDLWRFDLPDSREVHQAFNSYPMTLEARGPMLADRGRRWVDRLAREGVAILRYHDKMVQGAIRFAHYEKIAGFDVPVIPCPAIELISDVVGMLAKGEAFAASWMVDDDDMCRYSLRSDDKGGADVGAIAKSLGGGGHRHSAGFQIPGEGRRRAIDSI